MIYRPTRRRPGTSLVEVLVGFGILGIGVTSVITLFPFSALTLGQALRDDRTTTCAIMADGQISSVHRTNVVERGDNGAIEEYHWFMDNHQLGKPTVPANSSLPTILTGKESSPSYPVFVDPMGVAAVGNRPVGDNGETLIPRCSLSLIQGDQSLALRYCSLLDSYTFNDDGNASAQREMRYNFAWMLQRPVNRDRFTVRMQVVVYNKRVHLYSPPGSEAVYTGVQFIPGDTQITNVPTTANVRKGMWVMDGTIGIDNGGRQIRHGEFYRVVSVTDVGGTYTLEVHKPVARPDGLISASRPLDYAYSNGSLVVMPAVVDVFERSNLTAAVNHP
jgi:hypothetical protein